MTDWLRRAGRGRDADGLWVIWSVSEGHRGRRWREVRYRGDWVASSLLLETDPEGRFTHLELSTSSGLLTLHPETDSTLHGHAVAPESVEHVRGLEWEHGGLVLLKGSILCKAAAAESLRRKSPAWSSSSRMGVVIPSTLWLEVRPIRVERITATTWRFDGGEPVHLDIDGLPILQDSENWPLEE